MAYATLADLATFTGQESETPGDERRLQRASEAVDAALATAYYTHDSAGLPTDAAVLAAFKNAVCAQVEYWRATGDELGAQGQYRAAPGSQVRSAPQVLAGSGWALLCPRARGYLRVVPGVWVFKPIQV